MLGDMFDLIDDEKSARMVAWLYVYANETPVDKYQFVDMPGEITRHFINRKKSSINSGFLLRTAMAWLACAGKHNGLKVAGVSEHDLHELADAILFEATHEAVRCMGCEELMQHFHQANDKHQPKTIAQSIKRWLNEDDQHDKHDEEPTLEKVFQEIIERLKH